MINNIVAKFNFLIGVEEEKESFNKRAIKNTFKAKYPAVAKLQPDSAACLTSKKPVIPRIKSLKRKTQAAGTIIAKKRKYL